jgi:hypothetical protein
MEYDGEITTYYAPDGESHVNHLTALRFSFTNINVLDRDLEMSFKIRVSPKAPEDYINIKEFIEYYYKTKSVLHFVSDAEKSVTLTDANGKILIELFATGIVFHYDYNDNGHITPLGVQVTCKIPHKSCSEAFAKLYSDLVKYTF